MKRPRSSASPPRRCSLTNVRFTVTVTPDNVFKRALAALMKSVVHRAMHDSLAALKQLLES